MSIINLKDFMSLGMIAQGQNPVFRVKNIISGKEYAMKRLRRNDIKKHLSDFQEILTMSKLQHPNIMQIEGFCMQQSFNNGFNIEYNLQILMKMLKGTLAQDISTRVLKRKCYTEEEIKIIFKQLIEAGVYMQQKNIAHRDIKPENILLDENDCPIFADFSEAFLQNSLLDKCNNLAGINFKNL